MSGFIDVELELDSGSNSEQFTKILQWHYLIIPLSLLTHPHIFYQTKTPFQRNSVLVTRHHAAPVVTLFFSLTHVTYVTLHHTVVIRYNTSVTYRASCHVSGYLVIYSECYRFERAFFTLKCFLPYTPSFFSRLPWGRQFNLKVSCASC